MGKSKTNALSGGRLGLSSLQKLLVLNLQHIEPGGIRGMY